MKQKTSPLQIFCYVILTILVIAALILAAFVADLNAEVQRVRSTTPTPLPGYGSTFKVTPDPSLPTAEPVIRNGSAGEAVTRLQTRLLELGYYTGEVDGQFGNATRTAVTAFQEVHGLIADGVFGPATSDILYSDEAQPNVTPVPTDTPAPTRDTTSISAIQQRLAELGYYTGVVDGITGPATKAAIKKFQQNNGLEADGVCGPATTYVLFSDEAMAVAQTPVPDPDSIPGVMDNGFPILVNDDNHIPEDYEFKYLVNMKDYCDSSIVKIKGSDIQAEKYAVDALMVLLQAAIDDGHTGWQVNAGYRSIQYQQELFDEKVYAYRQEGLTGTQARAKTRQTVADPGSSEHHTGLAFDVAITGESAFGATKQSVWLRENCWEYGFIIRYQADKTSITGISYEPWHIRYVGTEHSVIMRNENLCLEEYIDKYAN